jgi:NAD:arginine ADP-ribosyltransferase
MAKQRKGKTSELHRLMPLIESQKAGLAKLPGYEGIVYRGADDVPEEFLAQHQGGAEVKYTAFTSTSRDERSAFGCRYRFLVYSQGGAKDISLLSAHKEEAEQLFPLDTCFQVLEVEQQGPTSMYYLRECPRGDTFKAGTAEHAAIVRQLDDAARHLLAVEAALSDEELLTIKKQWAQFRDKVASGCSACAPDELSPYEAAKQEQARRERKRRV